MTTPGIQGVPPLYEMSNFYDTNYYVESNNEIRRREDLKRFLSMCQAQDKELTATMVTFDHTTHSLRIEDDSYGFLTVRIRLRPRMTLLHVVRFRKKPRLGVVYTFYKADRLSELSIETEKVAELEQAARDHLDLRTAKASAS